MSDKQKYPAADAMEVAKSECFALVPFCQKLAIAGSLRRGKELVSDIEIVYIPRFEQRKVDMFAFDDVSLADEVIEARLTTAGDGICKRQNKVGAFTWGIKNKLAVHVATGIPIDFFAVLPPNNWWIALVIRTGSLETNLKLTQGAQARGRTLHAYGAGVEIDSSGAMLEPKSERDVFDFCGVEYAEPKDR